MTGFDPFTPGRQRMTEKGLLLKWTLPMQEEFIRTQGPYSEPLNEYLRHNWSDYQAVIFITYLYPTTYFGIHQLPLGNALFAPTLHDELPAYLPAFKHAAQRARELLWLTEAEQRVGQKLWGDLPGRVVGMAIDTRPREAVSSSVPYLLYCGRVDPNKGCPQMFEFYFKYKRATRSKLRLVITGSADIEIPPHPDIEFRGFVPTEEKFRLMAGASVYLSPSANESFSIVTLEAMGQSTPVLASGGSQVLVDHLNRSGAGRIYNDYDSFAANLTSLLKRDGNQREVGEAGRQYVRGKYDADQITEALVAAIEAKPVKRKVRQLTREQFERKFAANLRSCTWREHPRYSSFTQYDRDYYLARRDAFIHKYKCFYALSRTISPRSIIELGTGGGAGTDAYLSASPAAQYTGIDVFMPGYYQDGALWDPYEITKLLLTDRGFPSWKLLKADLRKLETLPSQAEMVVVDAAHDAENEYADLKLALTAEPTFIFVDDTEAEAKPAIEKFLREDLDGRVEYTVPIEYVGGGLVIKLRK
jgi:glycosyltransferase involved in cell wall biosynthesis